ncbi:MAG TPA: hypothetical protein VF926_03090 [Mycobacterium sp.]
MGPGWFRATLRRGTFHEDLTIGGLKMLVQQPHRESPPRLSAGEVLAEFGKTGAIVLSQHTDVGRVHVQQPRVVGYPVIT